MVMHSLAETSFAVIVTHARSMMVAAQIPDDEKFKMWVEATVTATFLKNLTAVTVNGVTKMR